MNKVLGEILKKKKVVGVYDKEKDGGALTFLGVLDNDNVWNELVKTWKKSSTQNSYLSELVEYVVPFLNDKAFEEYSREDFDNALEKIENNLLTANRKNISRILHNNAYRIGRVTEAAEKVLSITNVLWGTSYNISPDVTKERRAEKGLVRNRKSLTISEEKKIADTLFAADRSQIGQNMGLALMFCLGLRNNEACAASFADIKRFECDENRYTLWVYKTSYKDTRETKYSGKTSNVSRIVPLPDRLVELIVKREGYLRDKGYKQAEINRMTIACYNDNFSMPCKPSELGKEGTKLLRKIDLGQEMLEYIDEGIKAERQLEPGIIEKDPTTYLFRRNFATHMYILGLDESEIQYVMGHDIDDDTDSRNFYRNEDKLIKIAEKMDMRPVVNYEKQRDYDVNGHIDIQNVTDATFKVHLKGEKNRVDIRLLSKEPNSRTSIVIDDEFPVKKGSYYCVSNHTPYESTINIVPTYRAQYKEDNDTPQKNKERVDNEKEIVTTDLTKQSSD